MITQQIQDAFHSNVLDVSTVAGLVFLVFLTIYFFVAIKPGLDSKIRVNRQVQRRLERDRVNEIYRDKVNMKAFKAGGGSIPVSKPVYKPRDNKNYYKNDKGYQAFIKHNSIKTNSAQIKKHNSFKQAVSIKIKSESGLHSNRLSAHNDKVNVSNKNFKNWQKTQTPEQLKNAKNQIWSK